ncbi:excinuclease ATPase subunit [Glaciimonas soli]|uniref:Excinuclease ATPase subunit n=1 Tax=Glaciimonas soli TaxID=2590999 RepID=A0A843YMY0_9BURK|nr:excinuclease ATPase subunit [Glaciimonas soli]MQQ99336.1 excinuclease ATPase subunit [Glaciimonas soli]
MNFFLRVLLTMSALSFIASPTVFARDTQLMVPIQAGLDSAIAKEKLDGSIKFYFAGQNQPKIAAPIKTDVSNRKTNSFGKSDQDACIWGFVSALIEFQKRAHELGADAVVNIESYYKKNSSPSATEFECHAGAIVAGVALKGDFVKLAK